jgi:hypothetical protein
MPDIGNDATGCPPMKTVLIVTPKEFPERPSGLNCAMTEMGPPFNGALFTAKLQHGTLSTQ